MSGLRIELLPLVANRLLPSSLRPVNTRYRGCFDDDRVAGREIHYRKDTEAAAAPAVVDADCVPVLGQIAGCVTGELR